MEKKLVISIFLFFFIINCQIPIDATNTTLKINKSSDNRFENQNITILINNIKQKSSSNLFYDDAEIILEELLKIENEFSSEKKISEQIKIFQKIGLLPENLSFAVLKNIMLNFCFSSKFFPIIGPRLIIGGPMILSHLTLGGRIIGLKTFDPIFYENFSAKFNNSLIDSGVEGVFGFLPSYVGFSLKPVYITFVGFHIFDFDKGFFFPFFEILFPCVGFSIAFIVENESIGDIVLFEYNLDICLFGLFGGIRV